MKIAILTPKYLPQINGNTTAVDRLVLGLNSKKISTKVIDLSTIKDNNRILKIIEKFNPDIVHAFHAFKSGPVALDIAKKLKRPLLVTITGTDVNHDLFNKERRNKVISVLDYAGRIVVFHKSIKNKLLYNSTKLKNKIIIIKQSVKLERKKYNLRENLGLNNNDFVFLILAGIRDIKYHFLYINEFKKLKSKYNHIKLIISGPVLDQNFMNNIFESIKNIDWIYYLKGVPHDKIFYTVKSADVVMNTSISEGGMSNSVLEAMYCGKVVLASNIEGNRSIIKDEFNGLLFKSENEFFKKAEKLIKDKKLRERLGKNSKDILKKNFSFKEEIGGYVRVYGAIK